MVERVSHEASLQEVASAVKDRQSFAICGHVNPDGDCIGSELALAHALRSCGKQVACLLASNEKIDDNLTFLPGAGDLAYARSCHDAPEVFFAIDVPTRARLGDAADLHSRAQLSVTIDHHASDELISDLNCIDVGSASTSMLIWRLCEDLGADLSEEIATCCYLGLMTDTGRFQYQNTDAEAFKDAYEMVCRGARPDDLARRIYQSRSLVSIRLEGLVINRMLLLHDGAIALSWITRKDMTDLGARNADVESIVDVLRSIDTVHVACLLREREGAVRGSLRAKDDTDVAAIAHEFDGGGHKAAAGFTVQGDMDHAVALISSRLEKISFETPDSTDGTAS